MSLPWAQTIDSPFYRAWLCPSTYDTKSNPTNKNINTKSFSKIKVPKSGPTPEIEIKIS